MNTVKKKIIKYSETSIILSFIKKHKWKIKQCWV